MSICSTIINTFYYYSYCVHKYCRHYTFCARLLFSLACFIFTTLATWSMMIEAACRVIVVCLFVVVDDDSKQHWQAARWW
jgi:hypothetical protein